LPPEAVGDHGQAPPSGNSLANSSVVVPPAMKMVSPFLPAQGAAMRLFSSSLAGAQDEGIFGPA
jgi:hypothetical protein